MSAARHRGRHLAPLLVFGGALMLAVAAFGSAERLGHLRASGVLSAPLIHKVQAARLLLVVLSGMCLMVGMFRRAGSRGALLGGAVWLAGTLAFIQYAYPYHLFFRPRMLLRAALGEETLLSDFDPRSHLVVPSHEVLRARYSAINIHAHFSYAAFQRTPEQLADIIERCNVQVVVDLDGGLGKHLKEELARYVTPHPDRFTVFATVWFPPGPISWEYFRWEVAHLEEAKRLGVRGVKIWKNIGLYTKDEQGKLIALDDPRLEPLWTKLETLGLPVLIHVADPPMNFEPLDRHNESLEYLSQDAAISLHYGRGTPRPEVVLDQFERVVERHPNITFIAAHLGNKAYDLGAVAQMLDRHPNLHMDISSRASDLGRQPVTARAFIIRYADRLSFGTDGNPTEKVYRGYFRLLETADEYFDEPEWPYYKFGRWKLYGLALPDDVLRKIYHDNAAQLLGLPLLDSAKASQLRSGRATGQAR